MLPKHEIQRNAQIARAFGICFKEIEGLRKMNKEQEDAIYSAYLGICVLQTMCRKVGLDLGQQRAHELLGELSIAFPAVYQRVLASTLRNTSEQKQNTGDIR